MVDFTTWRSLIDGAGVIPDSVITRDADTSSVSSSEYEGEVLNPNSNISRLRAEVSANTTGISEMGIYRTDGTQIAVDTSVTSAGDVADFDNISLSSGTDYYILVYNAGSSYSFGFGPKNHPYTSTDGDLTGTVSGSSLGSLSEGGNNNVRSINNVELFV